MPPVREEVSTDPKRIHFGQKENSSGKRSKSWFQWWKRIASQERNQDQANEKNYSVGLIGIPFLSSNYFLFIQRKIMEEEKEIRNSAAPEFRE